MAGLMYLLKGLLGAPDNISSLESHIEGGA